eukprot:6662110-Prymnesium_polylepis.1
MGMGHITVSHRGAQRLAALNLRHLSAARGDGERTWRQIQADMQQWMHRGRSHHGRGGSQMAPKAGMPPMLLAEP